MVASAGSLRTQAAQIAQQLAALDQRKAQLEETITGLGGSLQVRVTFLLLLGGLLGDALHPCIVALQVGSRCGLTTCCPLHVAGGEAGAQEARRRGGQRQGAGGPRPRQARQGGRGCRLEALNPL